MKKKRNVHVLEGSTNPSNMNTNEELTSPRTGVQVSNPLRSDLGRESIQINSLPIPPGFVGMPGTSGKDKGKKVTGPLVRHPVNEMIPSMSTEDLKRLKEDIRQNGLKNPILVHEGQILDGWNRYQICLECGITPKFEDYEGSCPIMDCWSLNIVRRHLNKSQLAALAVTFIPELEKEAQVCGRRPQL